MNTSNEDRALALLGSGVPQEAVASALGVTPSYISQLIADEDFAAQVTALKFETLSKHSQRDANYDGLEDTLLERLKSNASLLIRPMDILKALQVINGAKRRGQDTAENLVNQQNIVQITMPTQIVQQFTTNVHNQVVKAGEQELRTIQSGDLLKTVEKVSEELPIEEPDDIIEDNAELALLL